MNINTIFAIASAAIGMYVVYKSLTPSTSFLPQRTGLLVAQDTGKTKYNQSKTGDASLFIQKVRRKAIRNNPSHIKETHTQLGSTTGAIEAYLVNE